MSKHLHLPRFTHPSKRALDVSEIERDVQHYLYGEHRQVELVLVDRDPGASGRRRNAPSRRPSAAH